MLEFLSNHNWIDPQIDYLVWLQNIRMHTGGVFDGFFLSLTKLGEMMIPTIIMALIYWCIDSKTGLYIFSLNAMSLMFTQFLKMAACVYRPWILSDRVQPPGGAFRTAGGYSFPSGHSTMASSSLGGIAYVFRNHKLLCGFLIFVILLVGFSRNFLGVHTPQDVVVGLLTGLVMVFIAKKLINWCEKDTNRYLYVLLIVNIACLGVLYYVCTKHYSMEYINGILLVDPKKAIYNTFVYYGWTMGLLNGVMLCRRFFPFDAGKGSLGIKILRGVVGVVCFFFAMRYMDYNFWTEIHDYKLTFSLFFIIAFFVTAIYPLIFCAIEKTFFKTKQQKV